MHGHHIIIAMNLGIAPTSNSQSTVSRGYKDFKFGMSPDEIEALNLCKPPIIHMKVESDFYGSECYKVAGKKRDFVFRYVIPSNWTELNSLGQLKSIYMTLLDNHVRLLELLHEDIKDNDPIEEEEIMKFFNDLMIYLNSIRKLVFSPDEIAEKDQLKNELMARLKINVA